MRLISGTRPAPRLRPNHHDSSPVNTIGGASSSRAGTALPRSAHRPATTTASVAQAKPRRRASGSSRTITARSASATSASMPLPSTLAPWASSGYAIASSSRSAARRFTGGAGAGSGRPVLVDMRRKRAQREEDATVLVAVRTQLEAVLLADRQRQLERVDRIQPQPVAEQRRLRVDAVGRHALEV